MPHIENAFINFIDKSLVPHPETPSGRFDLLEMYYGANFKKLREIKKNYDTDNLFDFDMSIPKI